MDLHKLPEAAAVVVADRLGVPESLQQRVGCRGNNVTTGMNSERPDPTAAELYLPRSSRRCPGPSRTTWSDTCEENHTLVSDVTTSGRRPAPQRLSDSPEDKFGVFGFPGSGLPGHDDGLTHLQDLHVPVGLVSWTGTRAVRHTPNVWCSRSAGI